MKVVIRLKAQSANNLQPQIADLNEISKLYIWYFSSEEKRVLR